MRGIVISLLLSYSILKFGHFLLRPYLIIGNQVNMNEVLFILHNKGFICYQPTQSLRIDGNIVIDIISENI